MRLDGSRVSGRVTASRDELQLDTDARHERIDWVDVLLITPITENTLKPASQPSGTFFFELTDGTRFLASPADVTDQRLTLHLTGGRDAEIAAGALRRISLPGFKARLPVEGQPVSGGPDMLTVSSGNENLVLTGTLAGIESGGVRFLYRERERMIPWSKLAALALNRSPAPTNGYCVRMRDGQMFMGAAIQGDDRQLQVMTRSFGPIDIPWSSIQQVEQKTNQVVFLSALEPVQVEQESLFGKTWELEVDRTFSHAPIKMNGQILGRGLCMHARSRASFVLGGAARQFASLAGILDEMNNRGCVRMRVLGDGKLLWESDAIRGGQPARVVLVNVERVRLLTLEVDDGDELDLSDQACWGLARVLR